MSAGEPEWYTRLIANQGKSISEYDRLVIQEHKWYDTKDFFLHSPLQFFKLNPNAKAPRKEHDGDAGWDLFYCGEEPINIKVGQTVVIPTGIALVVDVPFVAVLKEKSGLASKGVSVHAGVIDSGYRGEVGVVMSFRSERDDGYYIIEPYSKICQVMLVPVVTGSAVIEMSELPATDRGDNGFGSTGKF